ncbi:N,N-dimethylformamidase beta subunit family domain-containing protein [Nostoc sp.]|uniref:N,N-dimethylformamidase beta subunit family domain-containing protein n=1 Tax=Nostoc sp. TaxID=1180 RepID=UPI002FF70200
MTQQNDFDKILLAQSQTTSQTVFTTQVPGFEWSDGVSYELGMKFQSAKSGQITAIRYWKAVNETGNHIGRIWSATGSILGSVTFSNETASGWQQQDLSTPVSILANTTYVVTVSCNSYFGVTNNGLASPVVNGDLSSVADGNNAVFGSLNSFPTNSYQNSNYFRDIVFVAGNSLTKVSGDNQTGTAGSALTNPFVVKATDSNGNPQSGVTVNFAVISGGGSVSSASAVTGNDGQASTVLTLGTTAGITNTVSVTASGISSLTFSARANPANTNAIYLENQKPGTTDWRIPQVGQSDIAGYATATSVNKGGSLPIKVSLAQAGNYTIDVYRLGYYGGQGGRLILSSGQLNGITQPACNFDSSTRTVSCENWSTSYTLQVGNDWTSGLYIAKLTDQRSGSKSQVVFVVRHDSERSDILFQSSFNTLQAYNLSGGYSLYPEQSIGGQRAFKLSYDRPFAQHSTLSGSNPYNNIILSWEYNMVRWLESQSYDISYVTNVDVHANSSLLQQHNIFLSVGHDEYWSLEEFNSVQSNSINKAFFSANSVYWRVRFENSSTGVANRAMACYKDATDPVAPTNKFRSPENNKPESALKGNMYIGGRWQNFFFDGFDFVVKNSTHPYYANTNLNDGDKLSGLVGFEWDAINLNASPSGLVVLGESIQSQNFDQAELEGFPAGTDPRISQAVSFTSASGAKVFSTGSIQFMWGLDSEGVSGPREDTRAKQMVVNILADMGARPLTPGSGIIVP